MLQNVGTYREQKQSPKTEDAIYVAQSNDRSLYRSITCRPQGWSRVDRMVYHVSTAWLITCQPHGWTPMYTITTRYSITWASRDWWRDLVNRIYYTTNTWITFACGWIDVSIICIRHRMWYTISLDPTHFSVPTHSNPPDKIRDLK
jgi:hypothetical protein